MVTVGQLKNLLENVTNDDAKVIIFWYDHQQNKYSNVINASISSLNGELCIVMGKEAI